MERTPPARRAQPRGRAGEHSGRLEFDALLTVDPDVILVAPCGFNLRHTLAELPA